MFLSNYFEADNNQPVSSLMHGVIPVGSKPHLPARGGGVKKAFYVQSWPYEYQIVELIDCTECDVDT
jgi:hypothetical protein